MFPEDSGRERFAKWRIDLAIHNALALAGKRGSILPFQELLGAVLGRSDLLRRAPFGGGPRWIESEIVLRGLGALADVRRLWLRRLDDWKPSRPCPRKQFASLAAHLLATHDVPRFLESVWLEEPSPKLREHQRLYIHLARGHKIRGFAMPLALTRAMAESFPQAPAHFTVEQALRWCQVLGIGGTVALATAIAGTHLGRVVVREAYWATVLKGLIEWRDLPIRLVAPLIEFLRRYPEAHLPKAGNQPTDTARRSLVKRLEEWMHREPIFAPQPRLSWQPTSIQGFEYAQARRHEWSPLSWTIHELTNSDELIDEGRALRHCVGSYATKCAKRKTSIWSMRCHQHGQSERRLTIEVNPNTRRIVQARGKFGSTPARMTRQILEMGARGNGLAIPSPL